MTRTLGVLVHGAGWVSTQHIAALQQNPHTQVVAICSKSVEEARHRATESGLSNVAVYDNLAKALEQPGVDVVAVCTPQHLHCENVVMAAQAGKHMIIEKPVGISLEELRKSVNYSYSLRLQTAPASPIPTLEKGEAVTGPDGNLRILTIEDEAFRLSREFANRGLKFTINPLSLDDIFFYLASQERSE